MATLVVICGLPGSGKSTLAATLGCPYFSADDRMVDEGGAYKYDPAKLHYAHHGCQADVESVLRRGENCAVANTFSRQWEREPYVQLARRYGAALQIIDLFDAGLTDVELAARNIHGVSGATIAQMRARWEK